MDPAIRIVSNGWIDTIRWGPGPPVRLRGTDQDSVESAIRRDPVESDRNQLAGFCRMARSTKFQRERESRISAKGPQLDVSIHRIDIIRMVPSAPSARWAEFGESGRIRQNHPAVFCRIAGFFAAGDRDIHQIV